MLQLCGLGAQSGHRHPGLDATKSPKGLRSSLSAYCNGLNRLYVLTCGAYYKVMYVRVGMISQGGTSWQLGPWKIQVTCGWMETMTAHRPGLATRQRIKPSLEVFYGTVTIPKCSSCRITHRLCIQGSGPAADARR